MRAECLASDAVPLKITLGSAPGPEAGAPRSGPATEGEVIIVTAQAAGAFADAYANLTEDEPLLTARRNAAEAGGALAAPVSPGVGAALRFLAAAIEAKSVVEVGTGCGTSGIWLLRGMRHDAVLTSVDSEPEHQRLARSAFGEAGFASNRYRLIGGRALDVLPRLTDGGYDMVFCDADPGEYGDYLAEALRLLRTGGIVTFHRALWQPAAARDPDAAAASELSDQVREDGRLMPMLLPIGDGLLAAIKRPV